MKKPLTITIDPEVKEMAEKIAKKEYSNLSATITKAILRLYKEEFLSDQEKEIG